MMNSAPRFSLMLLASAVVASSASGCFVEQGSIFIKESRLLNADCVVQGTVLGSGILDIGQDAQSAGAYTNALRVVTNLPSTLIANTPQNSNFPNFGSADNNVVTFNEAETFFTTDEDRADEPALTEQTPGENNPRITGIGGTVFNVASQLSTEGNVFVTTITQQDSIALQQEQFVIDKLGADPTAVVRIFVNVRVKGITTGGAAVVSPPFSFPVDICQGCLTDASICPAGASAADGGCGGSQDAPNFECN